MFIFFILLPLLYLASNVYIFCKMVKAIKRLPLVARISLSLLFWVAAFSFFASMGARNNEELPLALSRAIYLAGSLWIVFIIYVALIGLLFDIARRIAPSFRCNSAHAAVIAAILLCYGNYRYRNPQIVPLDITLEKEMEQSLRIAVVSDLHLGLGTGKASLRRFITMVDAEKPDVILITGDLIDNSLTAVVAEGMEEELARLSAPMGIYMVPGNHEYIAGYDECKAFIDKTPIRLLRDTVVRLPGGVQLMCRDDYANPYRMDMFRLSLLADSRQPIILLDHQPREIALKDMLGIDVQLSGHTHDGQVWPGNYITAGLFEQSSGYRKWNHSHCWVSSGFSLWGPPLRLGTRGDFAIITLRGKGNAVD